jgi:Family of unknown function (DUF5946)
MIGSAFSIHLSGMYAALEGEDASSTNQVMQNWLSTNPQVEKPFSIPERRGNLTVIYIHSASDADEHVKRVWEWARDIWGAWSEHHALARRLIDEATSQVNKN